MTTGGTIHEYIEMLNTSSYKRYYQLILIADVIIIVFFLLTTTLHYVQNMSASIRGLSDETSSSMRNKILRELKANSGNRAHILSKSLPIRNYNNQKTYPLKLDTTQYGITDDVPIKEKEVQEIGETPFVKTSDQSVSTFSTDVDTASFTLARNYINHRQMPPKNIIRVEEFINYFNYDYPAPEEDVFAIHTEIAPSPYGKGLHLLRVGIKGKEIRADERKAANIVFLVDVSGSMNSNNRLSLVKQTLVYVLDNLREDDKVGIVSYNTRARIVSLPKYVAEKQKMKEAIKSLHAGGSTNIEAGLLQAYDLASSHFDEERINRVILCTDGVANTGSRNPDELLVKIKEFREKGITLTAAGFGMGNYNDVLMETLVDKGDGNYGYVDTLNEAKKLFGTQLTGTLQVIAKDAKIQLSFNPNTVNKFRLLGYENRMLKEEDFRNNKVDAGEVGAGHMVTALYELELDEEIPELIGTVHIRYKDVEKDKFSELSHIISELHIRSSYEKASPMYKFSASVAEFAELLRESKYNDNSAENIMSVLNDLEPHLKNNVEYSEFIALVRQFKDIDGGN